MSKYQVFWITWIALGLLSAVGAVALGCYLLRRVVEDLSNSMTREAYSLRSVRMAPGLSIVIFERTLIWLLVKQTPFLEPPQ